MSRPTEKFLPLYVGDYLGDTSHLNTTQHGAYLLLIMHYWRNGPLADDDEQLANITKLPQKEWQKHRKIILAFFVPATINAETVLTHDRVEHELARAAKLYAERSKAGSDGAAKRWQTDGKAIAEPLATGKQNDAISPSHTQSAKADSDSSDHGSDVAAQARSPQKPAKPNKTRDDFSTEFVEWYQKFPRHEARGDAEKAYRAARKAGASREQLLETAEKYALSRQGEDATYTKLPAGWLRAKRWLDEARSGLGDEQSTPEQITRMRRICLRDWADGKPWPAKNISGNGVWRDQYGIGPPPDDPRTLVTSADLVAVPEAKTKLDQLHK